MFEQHQTTNRWLTAGGGSISNRQMAHFPSGAHIVSPAHPPARCCLAPFRSGPMRKEWLTRVSPRVGLNAQGQIRSDRWHGPLRGRGLGGRQHLGLLHNRALLCPSVTSGSTGGRSSVRRRVGPPFQRAPQLRLARVAATARRGGATGRLLGVVTCTKCGKSSPLGRVAGA